MIYISVALMEEAKIFIEFYNLKRDNNIKKIQVFGNEKVKLVISGVGMLKSIVSISLFLSYFQVEEKDIFLNFGVCGSREKVYKIGDIVFANKVINRIFEKNYYPDMLYYHNFEEGVLETFDKVVGTSDTVIGDIVDMEGAGAIEVAGNFFTSDRILIVKVVSDYLENLEMINIREILGINFNLFIEWLEKRKELSYEKKKIPLNLMIIIEEMMERLRLSETLKNEFKELCSYYYFGGNDLERVLRDYLEIEIGDKREGKKIFDEFKKRVV